MSQGGGLAWSVNSPAVRPAYQPLWLATITIGT